MPKKRKEGVPLYFFPAFRERLQTKSSELREDWLECFLKKVRPMKEQEIRKIIEDLYTCLVREKAEIERCIDRLTELREKYEEEE